MVKGVVINMASNKSKNNKKASKEVSKQLVKKTKTAKKTLKQLKKEEQGAEALLNYCKSMGSYFAEQAALENILGDSPDSPAGESICQTRDKFLKGFHESEEYVNALTVYRNKFDQENVISPEEKPEVKTGEALPEEESETAEY
jgi:protein subunit release factor A